MALTVSTRPEKTVNSVLSRWNAANLPMQYSILNTKWPVNSEDGTVAITSITSTNGNATLQHGSSTGIVAKEWVLVAGTTNYNGAHQVISVSTNALEIDFPFGASETGTSQVYYKNYTSLIQVYAGIDPAHDHAALKPIALIGTLEMLPDSDNLTNADVRDYVKDKLSTDYDPSLGGWPNDLNGWTDFYIAFAERYDLVTAGVVGNFTSSFTNDEEDASIVYCKGVHGALQFGYEFGGNLGEYVVNDHFYFDLAKWMTFFERSKILDYHRFDISIIIHLTNREDVTLLEIIEYDINGTLLLLTEQSIPDQDYGVYRLPINFEFQVLTEYLTIQIKIAGIENSVLHTVDIDVDCFPFPTAPAAPSNLVATPLSVGQIDLVWVDNSDDESGFQIWRGLGSGAKSLIDSVATNIVVYSDTGLAGATEYCYEVRAIGRGFSDFSNESCAATLSLGIQTDGVNDIMQSPNALALGTTNFSWRINFKLLETLGASDFGTLFGKISGTQNMFQRSEDDVVSYEPRPSAIHSSGRIGQIQKDTGIGSGVHQIGVDKITEASGAWKIAVDGVLFDSDDFSILDDTLLNTDAIDMSAGIEFSPVVLSRYVEAIFGQVALFKGAELTQAQNEWYYNNGQLGDLLSQDARDQGIGVDGVDTIGVGGITVLTYRLWKMDAIFQDSGNYYLREEVTNANLDCQMMNFASPLDALVEF